MCVERSQAFAAHVRIECQHLRASQRPNATVRNGREHHERSKTTMTTPFGYAADKLRSQTTPTWVISNITRLLLYSTCPLISALHMVYISCALALPPPIEEELVWCSHRSTLIRKISSGLGEQAAANQRSKGSQHERFTQSCFVSRHPEKPNDLKLTLQHPLVENRAWCISTHMFSKIVARKQMAFPGDVQHWAVLLAKCFSCQTRDDKFMASLSKTCLSELEHVQHIHACLSVPAG